MQERRRPKIFISYCREDGPTAEKLFNRFVQLGADPWLDTEKLLPGHRWKREISAAIKESDFFVALLSTRSVNKRGYVQKELREALDVLETVPEDQAFIIPCRLDDCVSAHDKLLDVQRVDLFPDFEQAIKSISRSIELQYASPITSVSNKARSVSEGGRARLPVRLQFEMSLETEATLDDLRKTLGSGSRADVIRQALALLQIVRKEVDAGSSLRLRRGDDEFEILMPR
ncbi:MAG: toll/interleukin-1 receptor domain-containing protein [Methylorubrum extorquens]|jgi:hypothetical protein|uniref:toll/interleukin-1 receptor domain-containing protein n=1 Tax=Methylorubrum extorquens TaxID=408 RepID=UPI002FEE360E